MAMLDPEKSIEDNEKKALAEKKTIEHFQQRVQESAKICQGYWDKADENHQFVRGGDAQWEEEDLRVRKLTKRPTFAINDTALATNAIAGREITGRFQPTFIGRGKGDDGFAEALKEFVRKVRDRCDAEQEESDAFRDTGIQGVSWVEWRQDLAEPPLGTGKTIGEGVDIWEMLWDGRAKKRNLSDRLWDARGRWISFEEFIAMFPDEEERVKDVVDDSAFAITDIDRKTHRWPWLYVGKGLATDETRNEVFLVDYVWKERTFDYLVILPPRSGEEGAEPETQVISAQKMEELKELLPEGEELLDFEPVANWQYKRAFIVGSYLFGQVDLSYNSFPRQAITAFPYKQRDKTRFYGWVDMMKDPQRFKNLITSMSVTILQHLPKGRTFFEPGAFKNPTEAARKGSLPGAFIQMLPGALNPAYPKLKEEKPGQFPNFLESYLGMAEQAVWRPVGLTPESLGQVHDLRRISGTTFQSVQDAISSVLSYLFDSLRLYRKQSGRLLADMMIAHYEWADVVRIIGEDKAIDEEPVIDPQTGQPAIDPQTGQPQMQQTLLLPEKDRWEEMAEFDIIVEEQPTGQSEQREFWDFFTRTDMIGKWVEQGLMPIEIAIEAMPFLSESKKKMWIKHVEQQRAAQAQAPPPEQQ